MPKEYQYSVSLRLHLVYLLEGGFFGCAWAPHNGQPEDSRGDEIVADGFLFRGSSKNIRVETIPPLSPIALVKDCGLRDASCEIHSLPAQSQRTPKVGDLSRISGLLQMGKICMVFPNQTLFRRRYSLIEMDTSMPLGGRSLAIFTVAVVMMCLSVLAVLLRVFVRSYLVRAFGWDDTLMVAALGLFTFLNICCIIGTENGIGHKIEDFKSLDTLKRAMLWWWLGQMLYVWSSAVAKVSIALALIRLTVRKIHMIILWTVIAVVIAIGLMFWFVLLFDCQPVSYFWSRVDVTKSGTCLSTDILLAIAYLYSAITIFCDFTLGIFPVFLIWSLQMNGRTKAALGGILSMGAVASVAVVIRLPFLQNYKDTDFLYSTYQIAIWSVMETGLAIIAGSLITLRPLFRWFLDGTVSFPQSDRRGKYPLSSLTGNTSKTAASRDPKYWRPDVTSGDTSTFVVTSVSAPDRLNDSDNSSQEVLYPVPDPWFPQNGVNVHKSFRVGEETP